MGDGPDSAHRRLAGLDDTTVEALGKLSEALETPELRERRRTHGRRGHEAR